MRKKNLREKPRQTESRPSFVFEELEPRLLLSADLPIDVPIAYPSDDSSDEELFKDINALQTETPAQHTASRELVFVDTDTPDYQLLLDDLTKRSDAREFEVILLDNSSDGIAQISESLSQHTQLDAVHIISHGSEGAVDLGGNRLEFDSLLANANSISGWSNAFAEHGDLLIYGCNLATSDTGQALVDSLARLTGAEVAASDDLTGSAEPGGDWELEYQTGRIETSVAVSAELRRDWTGTLAAPVANDNTYTVNQDATLTVDWWNSAWSNRQQLTFDNSGQAENLTDFPVLIVLNAGNIDYAKTQDNGADLRFVDSGGQELAYEIEQWNESGDSTVWVRVPQITGNSTSDSIWMYYGNAAAPPSGDSASVWDNNFVGVWHLNEEQAGTGGVGVYEDSTSFGNDGIDRVSAAGQEGQVGDGQQFGANDWIEINHDSSIDLKDSMTISFWIKPTADSGQFNRVVEKGLWGYNNSYYFGGGDGTNDLTFYLNGQEIIDTPDGVLTVGDWQHAAVSYLSNGDGTGTAKLYLNGVEIATGNYTNGVVPGNIGRLAIGHDDPLYDFDGLIDEVQISNTDRSADWIAAQHKAMTDTFVSFGGAETAPTYSNVLANDTDSDGDSLSAVLVNGPSNAASFTLNQDGSFTYTPNGGFSGIDTFTYKANDGSSDSNTATVTITVNNVPVITSNGGGATANINVAENTTAVTTVTATDADLDIPTYSISGGADSALFGIDTNSGVLTFNALPDFEAPADSNADNVYVVEVTANDGNGGTDVQTINVTVTAANDAPEMAAWYNDAWESRKALTVSAAQVAGDLTEFPVLISLNVDAELAAQALANGDDILFTAADGVTKLAHEIEYFDEATGELRAWVKTDLSASVDTNIYMYFGNDAASNQENAAGIWGNYVGVYHLSESPTGAIGEIIDSSGSGNHATTEGAMDAADSVSTTIGQGLAFDGVNDMIRIPDSASLDSINNEATFSLWINFVDAADGDTQIIMSSSNRYSGWDGYEWANQGDGDHFFYPDAMTPDVNYNLGGNPFTNGVWHHLAATMDFTSQEVRIYVDGNPMTFTYEGVPGNWTTLTSSDDMLWGGNPDRATRYFLGMMDEIRIASVAHSQAWIQTEFNNQSAPGSFLSVGTTEGREDRLTDINEDDFSSAGDSVLSIISSSGADRITDDDAGAVEGIAVIAVDDSNGQWQYDANADGTWLAFGAVSDTNAVLLDTGALVRFVPTADYNGSAGELSFRAWDQTSGFNGDTGADVSVNGGTSAYSTATFRATTNVLAVNDGPYADDDPLAYSAYLTTLSPSGHWRLGEASGGVAVDQTGLNDGNYSGVALGQTGAISADTNTASQFNGIDSYVELAHNPAYLLDDGTVQLWFKTSDVNQSGHLFSKDALGDGTGGHASIYLDGAGHVEVRLQSTTTDYFVTSTLPLVNDQWHHVAFTFGTNGMELYVDGQLQDTDGYTGGLGTTSGGAGNYEPITIGASTQLSASGVVTPLEDYFTGFIDEAALFGAVLSADEIQNLYVGGFQNYTLVQNDTLNVSTTEGVLINDNDPEGDSLTAILVSGPSNAVSFTLNPDGSFTYTPNAGFSGIDTFTYKANDGNSDSNTATVTITVNSPPAITSNGGGVTANINVAENTTAVTTVTATDADLDTLSYSISGGADAALFSIDTNSGVLSFDSSPNFEAPADANTDNVYEVTVQASDGKGGTDTQTISVTVTEVLELVVTSTNATGTGSLHEAILNANANTGVTDTITFNIPGGGPHVINLTGALPAITDTVIIDGTTDPDYGGMPMIVLDGSGAGSTSGLTLNADNSTIRGLVINGFAQNGILVNGNGNTIAGNWIGVDPTGMLDSGNSVDGIQINGDNNIIGGSVPADRNVISGNGDEGIDINSGASGTIIQGNYVGTNANGTAAIPNGAGGVGNWGGILVGGDNTTVGGSNSGEGNLVSGNNSWGIIVESNNNIVQGNLIGTAADGTTALGNTGHGLVAHDYGGGLNNLIGGTVPGAGNVIANNGLDGIAATGNVSATFLGNIILNNAGMGIDLGDDGISSNDAGDIDSGSNALQNFPVITSAELSGTDLALNGFLDTDGISTQYRIEFFGNAAGTQDATNGEARVYLGATTVTTDGSGDATFSNVTLSGITLSVGDYVTATATVIDAPAQIGVDDQLAYGSTSEFATNVAMVTANAVPTTTGIADVMVNEDDPNTVIDLFAAFADAEDPDASLVYTITGNTNAGLFSATTIDGAAGTLTLDYAPDAHGTSDITVRATDTGGQWVESTFTVTVTPTNDAPTGSVTIDNMNPTQGDTLTASNTLADADGLSGSISYQWYRGGAPIGGATASTYTTVQADVGNVITVVASYTDDQGTDESVTSAATAAVTNVNDAPTGSVTISGTPTEDQVLTATNTLADADGLGTIGYQWQRNGIDIGGANSSTYTLTQADVGATITVVASYTDGQGTNESVSSAGAGPVANVNDAPTGTVSITGTPTEDQTLTANNTLTDEDGLGTISYQWQRDGVDISGATSSTYTLTQADVGAMITVVASYTDGQGFNESVSSAGVGPIANSNNAPTGTVTISGSPTEDQTLTASNTLADIDGMGVVTYQWQRGGVDITGATASTYVLGDADVGSIITVVASYTDGLGASESMSSAGVGPIANINDAPVARPDGVYGSFDGDDFIQVADHASLQMTNNVTMEAWINHDGTGTGTQIILNKEGEYELALTAETGEIKWALANTGPTWNWYNTGNYITAGEWTHVAVTYDAVAGEVRTYINGALVDTAARSGAIGDVYPTYNDLFIGGRENAVTQRFQGQINEVRVWDSTRTQAEIQTNMDGLLTGGEPGLAGYWRLAEASGSVAVDQSPFGNDGILGGLEGAAATPTYQGYFTSEDSLLTVPAVSGVLANDFDIEGDVLTVTNLDTTGMLGSLVLNPSDGSFTYDPRGAFDSLAVGEHVTETFTYTASDGSSDSNLVTATITVTGANDAPTVSPVAKSGNEDTAITFAAADFTSAFSDVDSDSLTQIQITSLPANGTLRLAGVAVNVNDTIAVSQLGNLSFTPHTHWNGSISFNWLGHDGTTWTPASAAMDLTVNPINDAPISGMPGGQTTFVNTPLVFTSLDGNSISVADADGTGATLEITLNASNGVLSLSNTAGLVFSTGSGTNDATMTFTGDVATINAALDGLSFQPNADFEGFATLQLIADDMGNSGAGGALNAVDSIAISVVANASLPADLPPPLDELIVDSPDLPATDPEAVLETPTVAQTPTIQQQSNSTTALVNGDLAGASGAALTNLPASGELRVSETIASAANDGQQNHTNERTLTTRIWNAIADPLVSLQALSTPPPGSLIWDFIDEMTEQITADGPVTTDTKVYMIGTTATGVTFAFSAGYVSWLLRAGYLSAALLSSAPVWRQFDPLPILSNSDEEQPTSGKDNQDSARTDDRRLENIFESDARSGPNEAF